MATITTGSTPSIAIEGTTSADKMVGGSGTDYFDGGAGNDSINGGAGDDILSGGAGSDTVIGGSGSDTLIYKTGEHNPRDADIVIAGDLYDGGSGSSRGIDTVEIWVTPEQLLDAAYMTALQNDINYVKA
jgi:Ca2+-binding RTX toxin-like protein